LPLLASVICLPLAALADEVMLMNGGKLSGNILSIHENGAIRMDSTLAVEPLMLVGDAVKQIDFKLAENLHSSGNTRFELSNRDFLSGRLIGYSQEAGARIHADGLGEINLPVGSLRSMSLDAQPVRVIYKGPDDLANWMTDLRRGRQHWQFNRNRLVATGSGQIGRMLDLPQSYVVRMRVQWQGQPNFQLGFSDPLEGPQSRVDRYYLQFGRAGLEIKREAKDGRRYHTVGILNRTPDQFPDREMEIELRVDLRESVIHLAINGNQEGRFMDPFDSPPSGGGISLSNNAGSGQRLEVRELVVESWHENTAKPSVPRQRPAEPVDTLAMRDGDSFGGVLQSITADGDDMILKMKVGFRENPIEIMSDDVAMIGFAAGDAEDINSQGAPGFVLQLQDRGRLTVTSSHFEAGAIRAMHPLLGELAIPRSAVSSLERQLPENPTEAK